ncbi:MAG: hypothetical protein JWM74_3420, partial [Myxococcaceae bacterium]|nr:hypothetical protein [Myxococcaceae bacterium]
ILFGFHLVGDGRRVAVSTYAF